MPYQKIEELPSTVRNVLPKHAQEIYLAAFNRAWDQYQAEENVTNTQSRETVSHKIAWTAVKDRYHKNSETGDWEAKKQHTD